MASQLGAGPGGVQLATSPRRGGRGGIVDSVVAGTGISVNSTDPRNPIVNNTGVTSVGAGSGIAVDNTNPQAPVVSVVPQFRKFATYQFVVNFSSSAAALVPLGRWLSAAHDDGQTAVDDDDIRAFPFEAIGTVNHIRMSVTVSSGDSATVDVGEFVWTFEVHAIAAGVVDPTGISAEISSAAAAAQFETANGPYVIGSNQGIAVFLSGVATSGVPVTGVLRAFVVVDLYQSSF